MADETPQSPPPPPESAPPGDAGVAYVKARGAAKRRFWQTVRRTGTAAAVLLLILLWHHVKAVATGVILGDMSLTLPTAEERQHAREAVASGDPRGCGQISPQATSFRPLRGGGQQVASLQSECYFNVAMASKSEWPCAQVQPIVSSWWSGGAWSPERCVAAVRMRAAGLPPGGSVPGPATGGGAPLGSINPEPAHGPPARGAAAVQPEQRAAGQRRADAGTPAPEDALDTDIEAERQKLQDSWDDWKNAKKFQPRNTF